MDAGSELLLRDSLLKSRDGKKLERGQSHRHRLHFCAEVGSPQANLSACTRFGIQSRELLRSNNYCPHSRFLKQVRLASHGHNLIRHCRLPRLLRPGKVVNRTRRFTRSRGFIGVAHLDLALVPRRSARSAVCLLCETPWPNLFPCHLSMPTVGERSRIPVIPKVRMMLG